MIDLSLNNTWPLLEEIEKRMGKGWQWETTNEEVDQLGHKLHGRHWKSEIIQKVRTGVYRLLILHLDGEMPEGKEVTALHDASFVESVFDTLRQARIEETAEVRLALQNELRQGSLIAVTRMNDGLSAPIEPSRWDGLLAEGWLVAGHKDGQEIRVTLADIATGLNGRFAKACQAAAAKMRAGSAQKKYLDWLAKECPDKPPLHPYSDDMLVRAGEADIGISKSSLGRAYRAAFKLYGSQSPET